VRPWIVRSAASAIEQLLLPAECLVCHGLLGPSQANQLVCPVCRLRWRAVRPPWCERCGQPEPHFGPCRLCRDWPEALGSVRSAVWLDGGARAAIHALKYGGLPRIAAELASALVRVVPRPPAGARLVPIPLGTARLKRRGYNQSEALARALGVRWGLRVQPQLLIRTRDTPTQTALTPAARLANVAGAFGVQDDEGRVENDPKRADSAFCLQPSPVVLVDDVFTTGATLAEAARALGAAGFTSISAVTFGRASIPDFT
jgi:predicted amidophosphoribosyltransferase